MALRLTFIAICILASLGVAFGQTADDLAWARRALLPSATQPSAQKPSTKGPSFGQKIARTGFKVYKTCISSQDLRRCNFTLSCSEYCLAAIHKHGFVAGMVIGMDRYSRCHVLHRNFYQWDPQRNRSIDLLAP